MPDLDRHVDTFARAVATLDMDCLSAMTFHSFCEARGIRRVAVIDGFLARFPAWRHMHHGKGVILDHGTSAHARLAWAAFCAEVRRTEGAAP